MEGIRACFTNTRSDNTLMIIIFLCVFADEVNAYNVCHAGCKWHRLHEIQAPRLCQIRIFKKMCTNPILRYRRKRVPKQANKFERV